MLIKINIQLISAGLDRRTDEQQNDPVRVPFLPFEIRNPTNILIGTTIFYGDNCDLVIIFKYSSYVKYLLQKTTTTRQLD